MELPIKNKKVFIHSGAGLSQESGIKTFRDENGLWENHRVEEVATPEAFSLNPDLVYRFYNLRRQQLYQEVKPNTAHQALAQFQKKWQEQVFFCTQNVDDLLERAGCLNVHHMHGELSKMRCLKTHKVFDAPISFTRENQCPCCAEESNLRPHIVWFGEIPFHLDKIQKELLDCDIFLSIGTSNQVYPAASFIQLAKENGAYCIEVNYEPTALSSLYHKSHYGRAGEILSGVLEELTSLL